MNLHSIEPPYFEIVVGSAKQFADHAWMLREQYTDLAVRTVRGSKMHREDRLYDEIAAVFQFPYYFGENWAALQECLTDLDWIPAKGYVMLITDAPLLLRDNDVGLRSIFIKVLARVCRYWATEHKNFPSDDLKLLPFHVLFQCSQPQLTAVKDLLRSEIPTPEVISLPDDLAP